MVSIKPFLLNLWIMFAQLLAPITESYSGMYIAILCSYLIIIIVISYVH